MMFLLLLAGHDTTSNLIGNSVVALLDHPDQLARLRAEPDLIDDGIEELLRFTAPPVAVGAPRVALEDLEFSGTRIPPKGSRVFGMLISANRDESVFFADADALDLSRTPNKHLAFASGSHYCLGHHLARLEGRIAITQLLERFDHLEITVPPVTACDYDPSCRCEGWNPCRCVCIDEHTRHLIVVRRSLFAGRATG